MGAYFESQVLFIACLLEKKKNQNSLHSDRQLWTSGMKFIQTVYSVFHILDTRSPKI